MKEYGTTSNKKEEYFFKVFMRNFAQDTWASSLGESSLPVYQYVTMSSRDMF